MTAALMFMVGVAFGAALNALWGDVLLEMARSAGVAACA